MTIAIEFYVDDSWQDFTDLRPAYECYCLGVLTEGTAITIASVMERGDANIVRNSFTLKYIDPDAILDNDNPFSPYYQKIGQYMPIRLIIDGEIACTTELQTTTTNIGKLAGAVAELTMVTAGISARLSARLNKPFKAPGERAILANNPVAYWPLNEGTDATRFSSGLPNSTSLDIISAIKTGVVSPSLGTSGMFPNLADTPAQVSFAEGNYTPTFTGSDWGMECIVYIEPTTDGETSSDNGILRWGVPGATRWQLNTGYDDTTGPYVSVFGSISGSNADVGRFIDIPTGWSHVRLVVFQSGANARVELYINGTATDSFGLGERTVNSVTVAPPSGFVRVGVASTDAFQNASTGDYTVATASIGMVSFFNYVDAADLNSALVNGYSGETAVERLTRLCGEQNVTISFVGSSETLVGPQQTKSFIELVKDVVKVDAGILLEALSANEFVYRTRTSLYTVAPVVELSTADLTGPLTPQRQPDNLTNDVTVKRTLGGENRYIIPDGDFFHWTTEPPPIGANPRQTQPELNLYEDSQNQQHAAWIAHLGSWKEKNYGSIEIILQRLTDVDTLAAIQSIRAGDTLTLDTSASSRWLPPDETRQRVLDRYRSVSNFIDKITFATDAADPWEVTRVDTSGTVLAAAVDDDDTTVLLATTLGPEWSTVDEPYYIQMNGEAMRVTAMAAASPTFVAAGTVDADSNAALTPGIPAGMAAGGLMLLWATIRNSGTGTVDTVTGWNSLVEFGNTRLFYRYWVTGDSAPTVSFLNGAANATTLARIFGFSGLSHGLATGTKTTPAATTLLNSSAANVNTPAFVSLRDGTVFLHFAWKQDDWTSVAPLTGFTEMSDDPSALGDDAAIHASYNLTVTKDSVTAANAIVVTGGASAISRSVLVALRPLQMATVTRGVNGVAISHAALSSVRGWRMGVTGL